MNAVIENLLERIATLPKDAQEEIIQSFAEIEAKHLGVYRLSDDERTDILQALAEVSEGQVASDEEAAAVFSRLRG